VSIDVLIVSEPKEADNVGIALQEETYGFVETVQDDV
jgi:hypothetical protein